MTDTLAATGQDTGQDAERATPEQLRELFLFESLTDEQLDQLVRAGAVRHYPAGRTVFEADQPATCFYVLMDGEISLTRPVEGVNVEVSRTAQRGVYAGATRAFVQDPDGRHPTYASTMTAVTASTLFELDAVDLRLAMTSWFPMAMHLIEGLYFGIQRSANLAAERERLLGLGRLTAGLTHELNNPAAAAVRAATLLREGVTKMRGKLVYLAHQKLEPEVLQLLTDKQQEAVTRMRDLPRRLPMELADAEESLGEHLDELGLASAWDLAPVLAQAGLDAGWVDAFAGQLAPDTLEGGLGWIAKAIDTEQLLGEIEDATTRISGLVEAARQYSQLDRAPHQDVDVIAGLESTLVMLSAQLTDPTRDGGITVVREYAEPLPAVPGYPAELNQVWTNLIDNAIDAMPSGGTLTVSARPDGDHVLVQIGDTGEGIPAGLQARIFEPFFTTKPVGQGTGLGLDISYRIVTRRHSGVLTVDSVPGHTVFSARLPVDAPPADPVDELSAAE